MKTFKVVAEFKMANSSATYDKTFGPFTIRSQAEATLVQLSGQASCQGAEAVETEGGQ